MVNGDYLGFIGGAIVTFSFFPQVIRVYKLRSAREISLLFTILLLIGVIFWLGYGIYFSLPPVILWNSITIVLATVLIVGKLKYGGRNNRNPPA